MLRNLNIGCALNADFHCEDAEQDACICIKMSRHVQILFKFGNKILSTALGCKSTWSCEDSIHGCCLWNVSNIFTHQIVLYINAFHDWE